MRVYVDSSALLKRVVAEAESDAVEEALGRHAANQDVLVASALAWIEVSRAIRFRLDGIDAEEALEAIEVALSGIAERAITADVVSLARRIEPATLRTLDAVHLATAVLLDVDVIVTYDDRLTKAAQHNGIAVSAPCDASQYRLDTT